MSGVSMCVTPARPGELETRMDRAKIETALGFGGLKVESDHLWEQPHLSPVHSSERIS